MKDQDVIQSAYEDAVRGLFGTFFDNLCSSTQGSEAAAEKFRLGLAKARDARDRALKMVQDAGP